jgi:phenylalanyl-tRNA synthetase alpha subunit
METPQSMGPEESLRIQSQIAEDQRATAEARVVEQSSGLEKLQAAAQVQAAAQAQTYAQEQPQQQIIAVDYDVRAQPIQVHPLQQLIDEIELMRVELGVSDEQFATILWSKQVREVRQLSEDQARSLHQMLANGVQSKRAAMDQVIKEELSEGIATQPGETVLPQ